MIIIDLDEVEAHCKPGASYWQRLYEASQQMLTRALYENRVHAECLGIAVEALRYYAGDATICREADEVLANVGARLAVLEETDG